jgi:DNA repair protein SbcC/Rad50
MIPQELQLTNFLSYRETAVLDFTGIHLACISGLNGAGKSSLLDAMTWALFGKSRSKSDDDLVNRQAALSGEQAEISLTFDLENNTYRVLRRKKAGRSVVLELQMHTGDDGWKSLTEGGVRETQSAIEDLLRMNYDTFINASFLLQGQADEFTTKTSSKRKEILADLLGVSQWDQYRELVAEQRRQTEGTLGLRDAQLADIEQELGEEEERQSALQSVQAELGTLSERLQAKEALLKEKRRIETAVTQQKETVKNLSRSLEQARQTLANRQQTRQQRQEEAAAHQALIDEAETIHAQYAALQEADAALAAWQEKADQFNRLQQARRPHELAITQERSRLQQQKQQLEEQAERVVQAAAEREQVAAAQAGLHAQLAELGQQIEQLTVQEVAWREAQQQVQALVHQRQLWQQAQQQLQAKAARMEKLVAEKTAVSRNLQEAEKLLAEARTRLANLAQVRERHANAQAERDNFQAEQPRLRQQMDKMAERIERLQDEAEGNCPVCGQPLTDEHRQKVLAEVQAEGKELGDRFRANKERLELLKNELADLTQQLKQQSVLEREQETQQDRLARAQARLAEIETALAEWEADEAEQLAQLNEQLADETALHAAQKQVDSLAEAVAQKEKLAQQRQTTERQLSQQEARLAEIDKAVATWEDESRAALATVSQKLAGDDLLPEAQAALAELDEQIGVLEYDAEAHAAARRVRSELAPAAARQQALQQAQAALKPLQDTLTDLAQQIADQEQQVADLAAQKETAESQLAELTADSGDLQTLESEVHDLREAEIQAHQRVGAAQQRLNVLDDLRRRREAIKAERAEISQRIQRLKVLEKACGRDGVQALLIEQALPDIEERANELLERLTGGQMRVSFETQRQLKSRDATVETLDIRIVDNAGERPYENYSGGEQFRINFAIRLALSQVLAKRAGARLQTLVIDEGFGSQDPGGRQRLVEAINTIQDDFRRILVITHVDELRDAFPTRIEVEKTAVGSVVSVMG